MPDVDSRDYAAAGDRERYGPTLVTGAGRGIGRAIAIGLGRYGTSVCLAARSADELEDTAELVRAAGGEALCVVCDVTDGTQAQALVRRAAAEFGGLSILINNAGGAHKIRPLDRLSIEDFERGTNLNYTSVFRMMQFASPYLLEAAPEASVLNIVSIAARRGLDGMGYYSGAKAAVVALSRATAREWGPRGVRVNTLAPGWVETDLSAPLRDQQEFSDQTLAAIPLRRWGRPEDIAEAALFLTSQRSRYITGECLTVDGGLLA